MSSYEEYIIKIFLLSKVNFIREKTFNNLKHGKLRFDFYLPEYNIIIEVDGQYHFYPIRGRLKFLKQTEYDRLKNSYCLANNIPLYRIPYWEIKNIRNFSDILNKKFLVKTRWHNDLLIKK